MGIPSPLSSRELECTNAATGVPHPRRMRGAVGDATTRTSVLRRKFFFFVFGYASTWADSRRIGSYQPDETNRFRPYRLKLALNQAKIQVKIIYKKKKRVQNASFELEHL